MYSWMRQIKGRFMTPYWPGTFLFYLSRINCPQPHFPSRPPLSSPFKASLTLYILCLMNPFILQTFANNSHVVNVLILSVNLPRQSFTINYLDIGWCNQKWQTLTHCFLPQFDHIITLDLTESMGLKVLRLDFDNSWLFRFQFFSIPLLTWSDIPLLKSSLESITSIGNICGIVFIHRTSQHYLWQVWGGVLEVIWEAT